MPALLVEAGFLNTDSDNEIFDQQFENMAEAIAGAILGNADWGRQQKLRFIIEYRLESSENGKMQTECCIS